MARRSTPGGQKVYRYIKEVPLTAEDIMSFPVIFLDANDSIREAAKKMIEEGVTALPVNKDEEIVGIISRTDVMKAAI